MTFIEILIVLVIVGILAAVSVPSFKGLLGRSRLMNDARELAVLTKYARQQAVLRNTRTEIHIDLERNRYRLYLTPPEERKRGSLRRNTEIASLEATRYLDKQYGRVRFQEVVSAADIERNPKMPRLRFHRNGSAEAATVVIADEKNRRMTIEITGSTGATRVYTGEPVDRGEVRPPEIEKDAATQAQQETGGKRQGRMGKAQGKPDTRRTAGRTRQ